jgi:hypothetical protein
MKKVVTGLPAPLRGRIVSYEQFSQRKLKKQEPETRPEKPFDFVFYAVFSYGNIGQTCCSWQIRKIISDLTLFPLVPVPITDTIEELFNGLNQSTVKNQNFNTPTHQMKMKFVDYIR